jgi:hypothetical protein
MSSEELGGSQEAESFMGTNGVVDMLLGQEAGIDFWDLPGTIRGDFVELFEVGLVGTFYAAVELGGVRREKVERDAEFLAGFLKEGFELGTAIHLNSPDREGHSVQDRLEEQARCCGRGASMNFEHIPLGDHISGGEVLELYLGQRLDVQGVDLHQVPWAGWEVVLRLSPCVGPWPQPLANRYPLPRWVVEGPAPSQVG